MLSGKKGKEQQKAAMNVKPIFPNQKGRGAHINISGAGILNFSQNKKNAVKFLQELGNPYEKIFIDLDGTKAIEWGAYGVPESFLIYNNEIIKKYIGPLNEDLISEIKYLIK